MTGHWMDDWWRESGYFSTSPAIAGFKNDLFCAVMNHEEESRQRISMLEAKAEHWEAEVKRINGLADAAEVHTNNAMDALAVRNDKLEALVREAIEKGPTLPLGWIIQAQREVPDD